MKILYSVACLALLFFAGLARAEQSIVGQWLYYMKIYRGQEMPEGPESTLRLHFDFTADGKSRLYWFHEGDRDHCERRGHYVVENGMLTDTVDWVDPGNTYGCDQDPDMQNGKVTRTPVSFRNGDLVMRLQLGEEELFYVWKRFNEGER